MTPLHRPRVTRSLLGAAALLALAAGLSAAQGTTLAVPPLATLGGAAAWTCGSAAIAYTALCGLVARHFTHCRRVTLPLAAQPGLPPLRTVRFPARDATASIEAWYLEAAASSQRPRGAVVFVHGKDACRGELLKVPTLALAAHFAAAGLAVLMIDLRGHGRSSAATLTYGLRERHDVLGAVDWLRAQGHRRIGVLGASMGAAAALLAAAEEPALAAVVADSAFADFAQMIERQFAKLSRLPRGVLPGALAIARLSTGVALDQVRPLDGARALVGRPLLVIHSAGDRFVPASDAQAIAAAGGAELWITPTPGHIGSYRALADAYTARVLGFFTRHLDT